MNTEAKEIIKAKINELRGRGYEYFNNLAKTHEHLTDEVKGKSGIEYQTDITFYFENEGEKIIRVSGSIFKVKEIKSWWRFWTLMDKAVAYDGFSVKPSGHKS